jgi:hypothetical protein
MRRWVAVVTIAVCLSSVRLGAQAAIFTVTVASAGIRQTPSTDGALVGYKTKGDVLEVRRNLGAWIEVAWPTATGVAYVPLGMGTLTQSMQAPRRPMTIAEYTATSSPLTPSPAPAAATCACAQSMAVSASAARTPNAPAAPMQPGTPYIAPTHLLGIGGQMVGAISMRNAGATGRVWSRKQVGVQIDFSRAVRTNAGAERLTSQQFGSSVLYSLASRINDYVWLRPYLGGGTIFYHTTAAGALLSPNAPTTGNAFGLQGFGGAELTFAAMPRFAVSADLGYHKWPASFAAFEPRKVGLRVSGHWYLR